MCVRVVAGCAPCRVTPLTLGVTLQRSAAPPFPGGPRVPPGAPYQNTLGAVPQDPLTLKLRLDTNWTFQQMLKSRSVRRRRYALKVPAAHFMLGNCKPIAGSHAAEPTGWISSCLDRRPLPRCGGGVGGAEPSAASGGCSEAEHPQRSKKSSKRAARRFFRAPQGGGTAIGRGGAPAAAEPAAFPD